MSEPGRATSLRARVRAEMADEIKQTARRHLAESGAPGLSLRAVARELGMVSSAVYRYFASRDELLTALIIDAYEALGAAVEQAEAAVDRADLVGRLDAACHAVRDWALVSPHEYALTYGTPVPGYAAPPDTVGPASRVPNVLVQVLTDGAAAGIIRPHPGDWLPPPVLGDMNRILDEAHFDLPPAVLARGMMVWTHLFGAVNFELFGRLNGVIEERAAWFDHQVQAMGRLVGLRP
jgi:AcrR family transcriptional regulator